MGEGSARLTCPESECAIIWGGLSNNIISGLDSAAKKSSKVVRLGA